MTIEHFERPQSLEEAFRLVREEKGTVLGGMLWLRLQPKKRITCGVDLSLLGLDQIEETDDRIRLGSYITLRQWEKNERLTEYSHGAIPDAMAHIVGVQFRNLATLGGSIASCFGFSDVSCIAASLGMEAEYFEHGRISVEKLMLKGSAIRKDILTHLLLPIEAPLACAYEAHRNTATDFPILNVCVTVRPNEMTCAVGARPGNVRVIRCSDHFPLDTDEARGSFARNVAASLLFGTNAKASAAYRQKLCEVLVRRALESVQGQLTTEEQKK